MRRLRLACEGTAVECDGNTERRCNAGEVVATECPNGCSAGTGCNALPPLGFACPGGQCAAPNVCQADTTGQARCCARDCVAEGKVCSDTGSCVCQEGQVAAGSDCLLQNGDPCTSSQQCQAGSTCTDGVSCQEACSGACERCAPNTGLCVAVGAGQPDPLCTNGRQCTATRGDCRLTLRQPCSGNGAECTTNNCEPTVGNATQICCAQPCAGNTPFCRSDGNGCVQCETNADCGNGCNTLTGVCNELLPIGTPCGTTSQCASGAQCLLDQTSQTRCCERNCAAEGLLCNGAGRCVAPAPATLATAVGGTPAAFARTLVDDISAAPRTWTVQNTGASPSGTLTITNTNQLEFQTSGTCIGSALQPNASCTVSVSFAPREPGTRRATLTLNGGTGVAVTVGVEGPARLRDGSPCTADPFADCDSGRCTQWLLDADGDGVGSLESVGGFPSVLLCGDSSPSNRPQPLLVVGACGFSDVERQYEAAPVGPSDCCDNICPGGVIGSTPSTLAFPGAPTGGTQPALCASDITSFDFNCDGREEIIDGDEPSEPSCESLPDAITAAECNARAGFRTAAACGVGRTQQNCALNSDGLCRPALGSSTVFFPTCL